MSRKVETFNADVIQPAVKGVSNVVKSGQYVRIVPRVNATAKVIRRVLYGKILKVLSALAMDCANIIFHTIWSMASIDLRTT